MKKILAFAGSNSSKSINYQLVRHTSSLLIQFQVRVLDIRNWIIPLYSENMDETQFTPKEINELISLIKEYDGFVISSPEHNGGPTAFFKNITDWLSRRSENVFEGKKVLLLSTSPGRRGGESSRAYYDQNLSRLGAVVVSSYGLPSFNQNMIDGKLNEEENIKLLYAVKVFNKNLA